MKTWLKILEFMVNNRESYFSIYSIAKKLNLNYKIAFQEIKKLEAEGLVSLTKFGRANQCRIANKFNEKILAVELQKKQDFLKDKNMSVIYKRLMEIKNPFLILKSIHHVPVKLLHM